MTTILLVGLVTFNLGFLVGAFWVSAKNADAKEYKHQDRTAWMHSQIAK